MVDGSQSPRKGLYTWLLAMYIDFWLVVKYKHIKMWLDGPTKLAHLHTSHRFKNWHVFKARSLYESNAHWKRINSYCLRSHWICINRNSHWMRIQSIHFHRWFEVSLKVNCIMTWNNEGVIFSRVISCMKKQAIRQEMTSVTLLLCLGKLLYLLCHV